MANEYESIKTKARLDELKLSYTMREVRDKWNANMDELDDRADAADAKFEAMEPIVEDAVTYGAQTKDDAQKEQARNNIGAGTYSRPGGGIPASDLAESYYLASNPSGYQANVIEGVQLNGSDLTVTNKKVNVQAVTSVGATSGSGIAIGGTSTAPTVGIDSSHKLLSTAEYNTLNTNIGTAQQKADDAYALAEGRENATSYQNYQSMVAALNAETTPTLKVGDNIYIETVGVPDLWVSDVLDSKASYTYTSDQAIVDALNNPSIGYVNIGWYRLGELETAKVDLSDYVQKDTTVTGTGALGGGGALSQNRTITHNAGSAPNMISALYKISTDAYSHISSATAVQTSDLTPLLDDSYLAKDNPTGTGALSINRKENTTVGTKSVAIGNSTTASGQSSVALGAYTKATGQYSYAEGYYTTASGGAGSHAEGSETTASSNQAHAEGNHTVAAGQASHAEGYYTSAKGRSQHVFGEYNEVDTAVSADSRSNHVEIVGNGTADNARSNARTLDWGGNEVLKGTSTAAGFKTPNGTSSGFLKADGSVDTTAYTTNQGTVTGVGAGTGLSISGTASVNPTINIASTHKLPTTTEYNALATKNYVDTAVGAIDTKKAFTFTENDARWSSQADVDGMFVCTFNTSNTTGFKTSYIPLSCFNTNNEQVVATLAFDHTSGSECVKIKSDTKFAGTIYMI